MFTQIYALRKILKLIYGTPELLEIIYPIKVYSIQSSLLPISIFHTPYFHLPYSLFQSSLLHIPILLITYFQPPCSLFLSSLLPFPILLTPNVHPPSSSHNELHRHLTNFLHSAAFCLVDNVDSEVKQSASFAPTLTLSHGSE